MDNINIGVVGATGLVGQEIIKCLEELKYSRINIFAFASNKSKGEVLYTENGKYEIEELRESSFENLDYVLFSGGNEISEKYAPIAVSKGCIVIDNSSFYRLDKEVPLVCIGCNEEKIKNHKGIIANPNCSTIQLMRSLKIIDELFNIEKVIVSTYQSVSGIGKKAVEEYQINQHINLPQYNAFPYIQSEVHYSIKDNVIPQIDKFDLDTGYSKEELKMTNETKKILGDHINLTATCIRVPTLRGHGESVYVETKEKIDINKLREVFKNDRYIELKDNLAKQEYPLVKDCYYCKNAIVGRIRKDLFNDKAMHYYVVGDNLYLGAAYNAVNILSTLIKESEDNDRF